MDILPIVIVVVALGSFLVGFGVAYFLRGTQAKDTRALAEQLIRRSEEQRKSYEAQLVELLRGKFSAVSMEVMNKSQENFIKLAEARLNQQVLRNAHEMDNKKQLIDQQLNSMSLNLGEVKNLISEFEEKRAEKLGALGRELEQLTTTSSQLRNALADNKIRGQWGERIAEDILNLMGLVEGINYEKQTTSDGGMDKRIRPDFTFILPNEMRVNMDAKFPLDNYLAYMNAPSEADQIAYRKRFLGDVRDRIKEISDRGYIGSNQNTIECVLIFIPNEQIYRFIHEHDDGVINEALKQRIVLCSPLTLYVVLAIIRQAVDNFKLQQSSREILQLLDEFKRQWDNYVTRMDDIGKSLDKARSVYHEVISTRKHALEKPMNKIHTLRHGYEMESVNGDIQVL